MRVKVEPSSTLGAPGVKGMRASVPGHLPGGCGNGILPPRPEAFPSPDELMLPPDLQESLDALGDILRRHLNEETIEPREVLAHTSRLVERWNALSSEEVPEDPRTLQPWIERIIQGYGLASLLMNTAETRRALIDQSLQWCELAVELVSEDFRQMLGEVLEQRAHQLLDEGDCRGALVDRSRALTVRRHHAAMSGDVAILQNLVVALMARFDDVGSMESIDDELQQILLESRLADLVDAHCLLDHLIEAMGEPSGPDVNERWETLHALRSSCIYECVLVLSQIGCVDTARQWILNLDQELAAWGADEDTWVGEIGRHAKALQVDARWWEHAETCRLARLGALSEVDSPFPMEVVLVTHGAPSAGEVSGALREWIEESRSPKDDEQEIIHQVLLNTPLWTLRVMECFCERCLERVGDGLNTIRVSPSSLPFWLRSLGLMGGEIELSIATHPADHALLEQENSTMLVRSGENSEMGLTLVDLLSSSLTGAGYELCAPSWSPFLGSLLSEERLREILKRGARLTADERIEIRAWLEILHATASATEARVSGQIAVQLNWATPDDVQHVLAALEIAIPMPPQCMLGCPGLLLSMFFHPDAPAPAPGSHAFDLAVAHAEGSYLFKVVSGDEAGDSIRVGMLGVLDQFDPWDRTDPTSEWRLNLLWRSEPSEVVTSADSASGIPLACLEPATLADLQELDSAALPRTPPAERLN